MGLRILIADDHKLVRKAIAALLSNHNGMQVIAEANDGREALLLSRELHPDVAVMNIEMPNLNGVEATRQIVREVPGIRVVALSTHSDRRNVHAMLEAGARGYVSKHSEFEELVSVIKTVAGNGVYFSPELTSLVIEKFFASSEDHSYPLRSLLTERQLEILQLIAEGKSTEEIGRELYLSPKTVDWHRVQLKKKLRLDSTVALVKYAIKEELTNVDF